MTEAPAKRVLILTYYWPPSGGSGVQRWLKFAKYLPEFGWQPVVVTPENPDFPVRDESLLKEVDASVEVLHYPIREPYALYRKLTGAKEGENFGSAPTQNPSLLKRLSTWIRANLFVPDPRISWVKPTTKKLLAYLAEHPVDAIISTGPPHSVHLIAKAIKLAKPEIHWLLDVRDPWSQFDVHLAFNPGKRARAKNKRLERESLALADVVVGTSFSMPTHLEPFDHKKYTTVTNGYDAEDFKGLDLNSNNQADKFSIFHTGLLNAVRNPTEVWAALDKLAKEDPSFAERLDIQLIGTVAPEVLQNLAAYPRLNDKWKHTPWIRHSKLLELYGKADLFLLCPNRSDNAKGQINGKLFEYLALKKPILHIGPFDADNTRLLDQTHTGLTVNPGDVNGAIGALKELYSGKFTANDHAFNEREINKFERKATTKALAAILNNL